MSDLRLPDSALHEVGADLASAANLMVAANAARPAGGFDSLTGIAAEVDLYLRGAAVARAALADASKSASLSVGALMERSTELDEHLGQTLYAGFAVKGGP